MDRTAITLVVEDDRANRLGLVRLLRCSGHQVESASTIAEAMEKLNATPSTILLDLHLPDGNGAQVLERVRARKLAAKVCVLTGSASGDALDALIPLRPDAIMLKPFHPQRLLDWVREANAE
jgi:CheY-like chemotaxis protein